MSDPSERHRRLAALFEHAVTLDAEARRRFIENECADSPEMRAELESLLEADNRGSAELRVEIPASLARVPERIGRYRILDVLGEGGFGVVYLAEQSEPIQRRVAVKVIKPGMDTGAVIARFRAERQALAMMSHPNVARVFDAGATERGLPYFVMEYVDGTPITDFCDARAMSVGERLALFTQVCAGVQHAHVKGLIHRDLKPSNVLITETPEGPSPRIIDFGIAKATGPSSGEPTMVTGQGQLVGTPDYMSPEQLDDTQGAVDTRSDVYSLGVLLFELLVGRRPFQLSGASIGRIQSVLRTETAPRPSAVLSSLDEVDSVVRARRTSIDDLRLVLRRELEWIPLRALAKDPGERYQSVQALREDVERFLAGRPLVAGPPTRAYAVRKFVGRHKAGVALAAGVTVVFAGLVVGLAVATVQTSRALTRLSSSRESERYETYCARLYGLQTAVRLDDVRSVRAMLAACPEDLRGWEWRYLSARADRSLAKLEGHGETVMSVAFSPDGRRVVTGSRDGTVRVWRDGIEVARADRDGSVHSVSFGPRGRRIAIGTSRGRVEVLEADLCSTLVSIPHPPRSVPAVVFSPSGDRIATGSMNELAHVWDAETGKRVTTFDGHDGRVTSVTFTPDGEHVVSGSGDRTAQMWAAGTGERVQVFSGHSGMVQSVDIDATGDRLLTSSRDGTARVWDLESGDTLVSIEGHSDGLWFAEFSPNGQSIATASADRSAGLWSAHDGAQLAVLRGHHGQVECVRFNRSGSRLVTGARDGMAMIWDAQPGLFPGVLPLEPRFTRSVAFTGEGEQAVLMDREGSVQVTDLATGEARSMLGAEGAPVLAAASDPAGQLACTVHRDGSGLLHDLTVSGRTLRLEPDPGPVVWLEFSRDSRVLLTAGSDRVVRLWETRTGTQTLALLEHPARVTCARLSPNGESVVTACTDGRLRLWTAIDGQLTQVIDAHEGPVRHVAYSADGRRLLTSGEGDRLGRVWDLVTPGNPLDLVGHDHLVRRPDAGRRHELERLRRRRSHRNGHVLEHGVRLDPGGHRRGESRRHDQARRRGLLRGLRQRAPRHPLRRSDDHRRRRDDQHHDRRRGHVQGLPHHR